MDKKMKVLNVIVGIIGIISFIGAFISWGFGNTAALVVTSIILILAIFYCMIFIVIKIFIYIKLKRIILNRHEKYKPFEEFLKDAYKVDIIGINLAGVVSGHQSFIETRAHDGDDGCEFRFIMTDPSIITNIPMSAQTKRNTQNTYDLLISIKNKNKKIEIGLLPFTPVYSLLIKYKKGIDKPEILQVEIYSQIELFVNEAIANKRPHFILTPKCDDYWFDYFLNEFDIAWKHSKKI